MALSVQNAPLIQPETTRAEFLPFHVPAIGDEEIDAVVEVLKSGWLTTGSRVKEFEKQFCRFVGARHSVAVNSATAALHLALRAIGVHEGDEVIVPTMTFAATAEVVIYLGAKPVLIDCEPDTLNMAAEALETALTSKTKAIIPVHFAGQPCEMDKILRLARGHQLNVVEDAAHALPAGDRSRMVGSIGDITCFSFYATKTITTGEGGMATTDNPEWAEQMRLLSLHGIDHDAWNRYSAEGSWYYEVSSLGYKYNLTDIAASLGLAQLKKCHALAAARRRIAETYSTGLADIAEIRTPVCRDGVQHAWHLYVIQLELERLTINRRDFIEALREHNIGASVHFIPLHLHPYYRRHFAYRPADFPNALNAYERIVSLPIFPSMTPTDVNDVVGAVTDIIERHRR